MQDFYALDRVMCWSGGSTIGNASFYQAVYALVAQVPPGHVTTYGDLALALGRPRHARLVGYALARCPDDVDIPAHRVVNHRGEVSRAWGGGHPEEQVALLRAEGIAFTRAGHVDLRRHIHILSTYDA